MTKTRWIRIAFILVLLTITVGCDQVTKRIVRKRVMYEETVRIIDNHLTITKVENSGSFLGMGNTLQNPLRFILLTFLPVLFLLGGATILFMHSGLSQINVLGLTLVLGGGIGNVYDRLRYGSVTDFIHIKFGPLQTGVFNIADVAIMTGIFTLIIHSYIRQSKSVRVTGNKEQETRDEVL